MRGKRSNEGATHHHTGTTTVYMVNVPKENSVFFPLVVRDGVCYEVRTVESAINFCENEGSCLVLKYTTTFQDYLQTIHRVW